MPNVINQLGERFIPINIDSTIDHERAMQLNGGPKMIIFGLGADPIYSHVAFIGEEYVNATARVISLSEPVAIKHQCHQAYTIGVDIFNAPNLQKIVVVAKGAEKVDSIKRAFEDDDTGLGYLIKHHSDKLRIFIDHEIAQALKRA